MRASVHWPTMIGGGLLFGVALAGLWLNDVNEIGTARRMGPGYLPMLAFVALAAVAAIIVALGWRRGAAASPPANWRGLACVAGAAALFGLLIEPLGLAAAVAAAAVLASLAAGEARPLRLAALAVFLTAACWVVFVALLGIGIDLLPRLG
ncbi:MAG: tripartite tricarboxylate transporter TctB family protein [Reyranellaceae bacterium]